MKLFIKNIQRYAPEWTNAKLSQESGVSQPTLSQLFAGRSYPSLETIVKIAECLNVKPGVLLDDPTEQFESSIPADILNLLENQDPIVYDTVRNLLSAINSQKKNSNKKGVS